MAFKAGSVLKKALTDNDKDDVMSKVKQSFKPGSKLKKALTHKRRGAID